MPSYNLSIVGFGNADPFLSAHPHRQRNRTSPPLRHPLAPHRHRHAPQRLGHRSRRPQSARRSHKYDHWPTPDLCERGRTTSANGSNAPAPTSSSKPVRSTSPTGEPAIDHIKKPRSNSARTPSPPTKAPSFTHSLNSPRSPKKKIAALSLRIHRDGRRPDFFAFPARPARHRFARFLRRAQLHHQRRAH